MTKAKSILEKIAKKEKSLTQRADERAFVGSVAGAGSGYAVGKIQQHWLKNLARKAGTKGLHYKGVPAVAAMIGVPVGAVAGALTTKGKK